MKTQKENKESNDYVTYLLIGILVGVIVAGCVFVFADIFYLSGDYHIGFKDGVNSTAQNISNAYISGLLYTQETGNIVYQAKTFQGTQMKEETLVNICARLENEMP
jgi:hypothetical protein